MRSLLSVEVLFLSVCFFFGFVVMEDSFHHVRHSTHNFACVYMYACLYLCLRVCVFVFVCGSVCVCVLCVREYTHIYTYLCVCLRSGVPMAVDMQNCAALWPVSLEYHTVC